MSKQYRFNEALQDISDILNYNKQNFFLGFGTALGAYRENKFIEHDEDIDICILRENLRIDIRKLEKITNNFTLDHIFGNINENLEVSYKHKNGVKVDIFVYYKIENNKYISSSFGDLCNKKKIGYCRKIHTIRGLKKIKLYKREYYIPINIEEYLTECYGKDFMIPKKYGYAIGLRGEYKNIID